MKYPELNILWDPKFELAIEKRIILKGDNELAIETLFKLLSNYGFTTLNRNFYF